MYEWLVGGSVLMAGSAATLSLIWTKRYWSVDADDAARDGFSLARYEPMKRLLAEEDITFLKSKPGVTPALIRRFRAQRRKAFRAYLSELAADFNRLHRQARLIVAAAPEEYADLVGVLMRAQVRFYRALALAEMGLAAHAIGVYWIDLEGLLGPIESLHRALYRPAEPLELA